MEFLYSLINHFLNASYFFYCLNPGEIDPHRQNVIIVYGFGGTPNSIYILKRRLVKAGYNVLSPNIGWMVRDIMVYSERLRNFCENILSKNIGAPLFILGYSMGGLVALDAVRNSKILHKIPVVTLCTPMAGTWWGNIIFFNPAGGEMLQGSPWLKKLINDYSSKGLKVTHIRSRQDYVIEPFSSEEVFAPVKVLPYDGHSRPLFKLNTAVISGIVKDFIDVGTSIKSMIW